LANSEENKFLNRRVWARCRGSDFKICFRSFSAENK